MALREQRTTQPMNSRYTKRLSGTGFAIISAVAGGLLVTTAATEAMFQQSIFEDDDYRPFYLTMSVVGTTAFAGWLICRTRNGPLSRAGRVATIVTAVVTNVVTTALVGAAFISVASSSS